MRQTSFRQTLFSYWDPLDDPFNMIKLAIVYIPVTPVASVCAAARARPPSPTPPPTPAMAPEIITRCYK